jgi:nucleotide-binding universal stress UspA family protein
MTSRGHGPEVLVATDFSETAADAVRVAVQHARRAGARLHLLHVVPPHTDPVLQRRLEQLAAELESTVPVVTAVRTGVPAACIVDYAAQHGVELIVVGTHGRTGVTRALIGSVAERVVRTSPCPVLTVHRGWHPESGPAPVESEPDPQRCVVCRVVSDASICKSCRTRIREEALAAKAL